MKTTIRKGGMFRHTYSLFANGDKFVVPAKCRITAIVLEKMGTTAGNITIGSVADVGNNDIVTITAMSTVNGAMQKLTVEGTGILSMTADTAAVLTVSSAATGKLHIFYQAL